MAAQTIAPDELLGKPQFNQFIDSALSYKDNSTWKGDKRIYITFFPHSASIASATQQGVINYAIKTTLTGSYGSGGAVRSKNLPQLSTTEIISSDSDRELTLSNDQKLNQGYIARQYGGGVDSGFHNHTHRPPSFTSGSYLISKLNDNNPSLLVNMNKDRDLPEGAGDKEFVVISENLHPFIKDNLLYFLTRAGVNVSGDTSQFIKLDETNRNLS